ncbi:MAG: hypothetical protein LBF84_00020 [Holosporales bacterium]|nr:hypothetical protein [Holosporales bacterium]
MRCFFITVINSIFTITSNGSADASIRAPDPADASIRAGLLACIPDPEIAKFFFWSPQKKITLDEILWYTIIANDNVDLLRQYLELGGDKDRRIWTTGSYAVPLAVAATDGKYPLVLRALLEVGASCAGNPKQRIQYSGAETQLCRTILGRIHGLHNDIVNTYYRVKLPLDITLDDLLYYAITRDRDDIIRLFLSCGGDKDRIGRNTSNEYATDAGYVGYPLVVSAARMHSLSVLHKLLSATANVHATTTASADSGPGMNALQACVAGVRGPRDNLAQCIEFLLLAGIDRNAQDGHRRTALHSLCGFSSRCDLLSRCDLSSHLSSLVVSSAAVITSDAFKGTQKRLVDGTSPQGQHRQEQRSFAQIRWDEVCLALLTNNYSESFNMYELGQIWQRVVHLDGKNEAFLQWVQSLVSETVLPTSQEDFLRNFHNPHIPATQIFCGIAFKPQPNDYIADALEVLLNGGAIDHAIQDKNGNTWIHLAIQSNDLSILQGLSNLEPLAPEILDITNSDGVSVRTCMANLPAALATANAQRTQQLDADEDYRRQSLDYLRILFPG